MGGTVLREGIIIENDRYEIIGEIDAWETCLWSIKVFFKVKDKKDSKEKEFEYSNLTREAFNWNGYNRRIDNEWMKERKKYGQPGARKKFQYSKR